MKKTYKECCSEVSIKHKLGKSLVTGHLPKYWEEAAEIYASQLNVDIKTLVDDLSDEARLSLIHLYCNHCGSKDTHCQCWNDE